MKIKGNIRNKLLVVLCVILVFGTLSGSIFDEEKNTFGREQNSVITSNAMQNQSYICPEKSFGYENLTEAVHQKRIIKGSTQYRFDFAFLLLFLLYISNIFGNYAVKTDLPENCSSLVVIRYIHNKDGRKPVLHSF